MNIQCFLGECRPEEIEAGGGETRGGRLGRGERRGRGEDVRMKSGGTRKEERNAKLKCVRKKYGNIPKEYWNGWDDGGGGRRERKCQNSI